MSDLTSEVLDALAALDQAATPGPWSAADEHGNFPGAHPAWCISRMQPGHEAMSEVAGYMYDVAEIVHDDERTPADAALIAAMRNALPALIAAARERDALAAQVAAVEAALWVGRFYHSAGRLAKDVRAALADSTEAAR